MQTSLFDPGPAYEAHAHTAAGTADRAWTVLGGREPYTVTLTVRGEWSCSCPAFKFQGYRERPAGCRHTRFVAELVKETIQQE